MLEDAGITVIGDMGPIDPSVAVEKSNTLGGLGGDAAIMDIIEPDFNSEIVEDLDEFVDGVTENSKGLGKFSLYFVMFATIFVLFIFAYSLIRLIR